MIRNIDDYMNFENQMCIPSDTPEYFDEEQVYMEYNEWLDSFEPIQYPQNPEDEDR